MRVIFAAGGLLSRQTPRGAEIAVILRRRYGEEWCLPKGKLQDGESWEEAALREVKEETGCDAHISGFVGPTHYRYNDTEKVVLYLKMELEGQCSFQPSEEVEMMEWLPPLEALNRLTHDDEKNVISTAYPGIKIGHRYAFSRRVKDIWSRCFGSREFSRLAGTLAAYRGELELRIARTLQKKGSDHNWSKASRELLQQAELALAKYNIDEGWKCFQAAHRMEIFGYDKEELEQVATVLRQEAEKLKSWRKKATYELIGRPDSSIERNQIRIDEKRVYQAALLRDEHFNNQYYKISIRRGNLSVLFLIIVLTILTLPILAMFGYLPVPICDWKRLLSVALFGVLGATFSVAITLTRRSIDAKIPEQVLGSFVTWMRPAIGAAAAMAVYVLVQAGWLNNVVSVDVKSVPAILAIAFIAGFSERLVVKAIDTVSAKQD